MRLLFHDDRTSLLRRWRQHYRFPRHQVVLFGVPGTIFEVVQFHVLSSIVLSCFLGPDIDAQLAPETNIYHVQLES